MTDITSRDRVLAGAAVVAPALLLASTIAYVTSDGLGNDPLGGTVQVYAAIAFGLAVFGVTSRLEPQLPRVATALTIVAMVGVAGATGFGHDSIVYSYDPVAALSEQESASAGLSLFLPGIVFPLALAALGVAAAKARIAPRWAGVLLAVGGLCFPVSRIGEIDGLALAADALIAAGLVPIGLAGLRGEGSPRPATAARPEQVPA